MSNIIRIRRLEEELKINNILIPVDKFDYGNCRYITILDLKAYILLASNETYSHSGQPNYSVGGILRENFLDGFDNVPISQMFDWMLYPPTTTTTTTPIPTTTTTTVAGTTTTTTVAGTTTTTTPAPTSTTTTTSGPKIQTIVSVPNFYITNITINLVPLVTFPTYPLVLGSISFGDSLPILDATVVISVSGTTLNYPLIRIWDGSFYNHTLPVISNTEQDYSFDHVDILTPNSITWFQLQNNTTTTTTTSGGITTTTTTTFINSVYWEFISPEPECGYDSWFKVTTSTDGEVIYNSTAGSGTIYVLGGDTVTVESYSGGICANAHSMMRSGTDILNEETVIGYGVTATASYILDQQSSDYNLYGEVGSGI